MAVMSRAAVGLKAFSPEEAVLGITGYSTQGMDPVLQSSEILREEVNGLL